DLEPQRDAAADDPRGPGHLQDRDQAQRRDQDDTAQLRPHSQAQDPKAQGATSHGSGVLVGVGHQARDPVVQVQTPARGVRGAGEDDLAASGVVDQAAATRGASDDRTGVPDRGREPTARRRVRCRGLVGVRLVAVVATGGLALPPPGLLRLGRLVLVVAVLVVAVLVVAVLFDYRLGRGGGGVLRGGRRGRLSWNVAGEGVLVCGVVL